MKNPNKTEMQDALIENALPLVRWTVHRYFVCNDSVVGLGYDDLFQEGCLALCRAASAYDEARGKFETFAVKVIRNHLIEHCRALSTDARSGSTVSLEQMAADGLESELDKQCGSFRHEDETVSRLDTTSILESRKRRYQGVAKLGVEALILRTMGGYGVTEIAKEFGVKPNQVGSWMSRAVQKMRVDLTQEELDALGVEKAS